MNEVQPAKLNKDAKALLDSLFWNKLVQLETESGKLPVFSKQAHIKKLSDEVNRFIERNLNAQFDIVVLDKNSESIEDARVSISMKNFKGKVEGRINKYVITIDATFDTVTFYEWALNGVLLTI